MTQVLLNHFSFCLPAPRELLVLLAVRTRPEVHVDAEGDELDEEEHVGDGDAREEAVDGRAVHLLGNHTNVTSAVGWGGGSPKSRRNNRGCVNFIYISYNYN